MDRFRHSALVSAALATGALVLAGCGRDTANLANGKTEFVNKCGACHTLDRAGTKGTQGPNLDAAFVQGKRDGMNDDTIKGVVLRQIAHPRRGSIMPPALVKGDAAADVAAYVGYASGRPGQDTGQLAEAGKPKTSNKPIAAKAGTLTIDAIDGTAFQSTKATAAAGQVKVVMPNKSALPHNIELDGVPAAKGKVVTKGQTSTFTANLKPGTYTYFCAVPGHREAGMQGKLTVK